MEILTAQLLAMVAAVIAGVVLGESIEAPVRAWASRIGTGRRR